MSTGCTAKAKIERHVKRADAFFNKGEHEKARIEYLNAFQLRRDDPHVAARLGELSLASGDPTRAFQFFSHVKSLQPTNSEVRIKLATLFLLGGDLKKAREEAEQILQLSPENPDALILLANSAAATNEIAAARKRVESLATPNSTNSAVFLALGTLSQRAGNTNAAETAFHRALQIDPTSSRNNFALGNFYLGRGNTNKAELHLKTAMEHAGVKSIERLRFVEFLVRTGRPAEAEKLLLETVEKEPGFVKAWNELTDLALARNNLDQAAEYNAKALAREPKNREALLTSARIKIAKRDFTSAIAGLEQLAQAHPRDSQVQFQLATAHFAAADSPKALAALEKSVSLNPNNLDAILLRSRLHIAQKNFNSAIGDLNRIVRQYPRVPQSYYLLAAAHQGAGNWNEASAAYSAIIKSFPADPQVHHLLGNVYREQQKLPQARAAYEQALKINPDYLAAVESILSLDLAARDYQAAHTRVRGYLEKYPDKPLPHLLQARVYFAQQKNAEAESAVKKAIDLDPEFMMAHRTLADFYLRTRQTDQAIAKLESIVQKNNKEVASLIQLGMLYEAKSDFSRARETYQNVLKVNPNSYVALNNLAAILSERDGDHENAFRYARKAREVMPYDPFTADTYGWVLWKRGEYHQALNLLQQAADGLPQLGEVQYHLGMAHYMTGSMAPAMEALNKALLSTNDFIGKDRAGAALKILQVEPRNATAADIAALQAAVAERPSDLLAHTKLAQVHEAKSDWDKARLGYEQALAKNPQSTLLLSRLATLHAGPLKQPSRALELAKQAWRISPTGALAATLGPIGYAAGDFKWAHGLLLEAQRSNPDDPEVSYYAGLASYALRRLPQAQEAFSRAADSSKLKDSQRTLAKAGAQLVSFHGKTPSPADSQSAQAAINSVRNVDPQFLPALIAVGLIAEQKGDFQAARAQYESALKTYPALLIAQRQLALLFAGLGSEDLKAQQLITALRSDFPDDPELSKALGKIAYRQNDYAEAARLLRSASLRLKDDSDLLYHLGMAQYHLKDKGAKANLTRALDLEPNARLTADANKAIAELK